MDAASGRADRRDDGRPPADRRGPSPQRPRGDASGPGSNAGRPQQEPRRKRPAEQRFAGWGDGLERVSCASAMHNLATGFPVESRGGVATIPQQIVARRPDALLICNYAHCGPHFWPDGEVVNDPGDEPAAADANHPAALP